MLKAVSRKIEFYLILFLPILFSIGRFIPIVETLLTFFCLFILIINQVPKKKYFIKYIIITVLFIVSSFMYFKTEKHLDHIKALIIFFLAIDAIDSNLYKNMYEVIQSYNKFINAQLILVLLFNILFIFFDIGYSNQYSESWGFGAYQGVYADPHQCAYHICALLVIFLIVTNDNIKFYHYIELAGFVICVLLTGARVPTVLAIYLGIIFIVHHFIKVYSTLTVSKVLKCIFSTLLFALFIYIIIKYTAFGEKILDASLSGNFDSGRSVLRQRDWELFLNSNWTYKLFGCGIDYVYDYHGSFEFWNKIWSHNDFMQILCGMGLILTLIYCYDWLKLLIRTIKESWVSFLLIIVLIGVAFYNGLYIHGRFVFVMPLLIMYMTKSKEASKDVKKGSFIQGKLKIKVK